jgi:hypothetical protein
MGPKRTSERPKKHGCATQTPENARFNDRSLPREMTQPNPKPLKIKFFGHQEATS